MLDPLTNRTRCESSLAHSSAPLLVVCPPLINGNEAMLLLSLFVILIVSAMSSSADNNGGTNLSLRLTIMAKSWAAEAHPHHRRRRSNLHHRCRL